MKPSMSQGNNRSSNSMKTGEKLERSISIPSDIIVEIFSRLPGKSIARFRCLSKLWNSMLRRPYFTEFFLTRSSACPRLLFVLQVASNEWSIFSSPQLPNSYEKSSSLVVTAEFHLKVRGYVHRNLCSYTSGLIYFPDVWMSKEAEDTVPLICNPTTGQYVTLPNLNRYRKSKSLLGFDPIDKQFKVVAEAYPFCSERPRHKFLTLGTGKLRWRSNYTCPGYSESLCQGICINGVCYYLVEMGSEIEILCVDVRYETFKFIDAECFCDLYKPTLINYKGRLGGISWEYDVNTLVMLMCVLEDVESQEWSKRVYSLEEHEMLDIGYDFIVGVTPTGEIVISNKCTSKTLNVYYFNPEKNTLQSVEVKGLEEKCRVYAFVNHVEDIDVNDVKQLKSKQVTKQGLDIMRKRPKSQKPQKPLHASSDLCKSAPSMKNKQPTILLQNKFELLANLE